MSSRCALRITEQGGAGPPAFTALLGRGVVAALGEHRCARSRAFAWCVRRCARSRAWGAAAHRFARTSGLYASSPYQCTPLLRKHVHERHESPFFGQILTLVYTFWVRRCAGLNPSPAAKKPASQRNAGSAFTMAEREGFEPSRRSRAQRFSRPPHSTALPSLRDW